MSRVSSLVIHGGTVLPMDEDHRWFDGQVHIEDGRITAIDESSRPPAGARTLDASGCLVLPGLVQTHVHVVQSLARHRAEGLPLLRWLRDRIWPHEAALRQDEAAAAASLGIAELLATGTTAAMDMGTTRHHDEVFAAAADLGIRMVSGKALMDQGEGVPEALIEPFTAALSETARLGERWHGAENGRLRYAVAPRFALSCSEQLLEGAVTLARRRGWMLHTHASENRQETELVRELTGRGNVEYLAERQLAGPDTVLAHCVHLTEEEFGLLAESGTGVAHCPGSNLKLGSGVADLPRLLRAGVRVGLGADGAPCNNRLSIFREMYLAGTIHNLAATPGAVNPWTVLELATWRGAEVIGWAGETGRLHPGWRADVVVLRTDSWGLIPAGDPATSIVFGADDTAVRHVVVDGRVVVEEGKLVTGDLTKIAAGARQAAADVDARLGWS